MPRRRSGVFIVNFEHIHIKSNLLRIGITLGIIILA